MWTKLIRLSSKKLQIRPNKKNHAFLSNRYKALFRKQFLQMGLPYIFNTKPKFLNNPRNKTPKMKLKTKRKLQKQEKIEKLLKEYSQKELKWRQERLNNRKYTGLDYEIQQLIPFYVKKEIKQKQENMDRIFLEDERTGFSMRKHKQRYEKKQNMLQKGKISKEV